jgi:hypothetical protein
MYIFFTGSSLKIARDLIRSTEIGECWALFLEKSKGEITKENLLKEILGLNACNLAQTLKEILADREIDAEDRQDLLDDYIMENLRLQDWISFRDGAERMGACQEIEAIWERLRPHFSRTREAQGFKPFQEAIREVMWHWKAGDNKPLQEALLEFVETQHRLFIRYFRGLLEPFAVVTEEPPPETPPLLEPKAPGKPPASVEVKAPVEPSARVEPKALMEVKAPVEIPRVEPAPVLEKKVEEKRGDPPSPAPERLPEASEVLAPHPTDRLSQPHGLEDSLLLHDMEPEEAAKLPEPLLLPETVSPVEPHPLLELKAQAEPPASIEAEAPVELKAPVEPPARVEPKASMEAEEEASLPEPLLLPEAVPPVESIGATEPLPLPEPLKEPVPEKEAAPMMEPPLQMEKPLPKRPLGFAHTVDPQKLAKVLEVLLAIDPTIDLKPISPDRFPGHSPPKEPFSSSEWDGPQDPSSADAP